MNSASQPDSAEDRDVARSALAWVRCVAESGPGVAGPLRQVPTPEQYRTLGIDEVREPLDAMLMARFAEEGLEAAREAGVLDAFLPEVAALVGFGDGEWRHKDVWKHTKQVVRQSVPRLEVRWGALLHDIGKVKTRTIAPNGEVHFFGHSEVGAAMFRKRVARRLAFEGPLYERIHFLILQHLRASQYDGSWTDSAVRRFAREMDDGLIDLLDLSRADITTKRPERRKRGLRQISELGARIRKLEALDARVPPLPKGVGIAIMEHFQLPASRRIGDLKRSLEQCVEDGELEGGKASEYYVDWLETHRDRFGL